MANNTFDSWSDVASYLTDNYTVVDEKDDGGSSKKSQSYGTLTEARAKVRGLLKEIRRVCSDAPWNMNGIIVDADIKVVSNSNGRIVINVPFRAKAYRQSISEIHPHYSFLPVLMDRGWTVNGVMGTTRDRASSYYGRPAWKTYRNKDGKKVAEWKSGRPSFMYFAGTHELESVINKFNKENAVRGMRAELQFTEEMLGWIPGHYIQSL